MQAIAETRYARVGSSDVAYKVVGDGSLDLLYCYGLGSHVDRYWEDDDGRRWLGALSSFSRVIFFDRRGTGASDRVAVDAMPTWEEWTEDLHAVLDAADSERAAVFASLDAGPIAMVYAAMHPERLSALVLANTSARYLAADGYPIGVSATRMDQLLSAIESLWGTPDLLGVVNPDAAADPRSAVESARRLRAAATPRTAAAQYRYILESVDVRSALHAIQAPTLVLHTKENPVVPVEHGQFIAEGIEGARFVELPGRSVSLNDGHAGDLALEEVSHFLTGERAPIDVDRVLATVLFTDIVRSTQLAATLGDARWRRALDLHDRVTREQLRQFRGREINTTGDGFVATFDGPARAIRCAEAILDATRAVGIDVRAGLHTGECELRGNDVSGMAVHVAARVGAMAQAGEVLVTGTVKDLVAGSGIKFDDRGLHSMKGVPDEWRLLAVASA